MPKYLRKMVSIAVSIVLGSTIAAHAGSAAVFERGQKLLETGCSRCHAVGPTGTSPMSKAPIFRHLHRKYSVELLTESLAEGIVTGHADMPQFAFNTSEIEAIIHYLKQISER